MGVFSVGLNPAVAANLNEVAELLAADRASGDELGWAVDIDGDTAISGARLADNRFGAAYIFTRTGGGWIQQQKLSAPDGEFDDWFSEAALSGDTAIIGAVRDDDNGSNAGAAYIFTRTGGVWAFQQKLTAGEMGVDTDFGAAVEIDGDTAIIGARLADDGPFVESGSAYVFTRTNGVWALQQKLTAPDAANMDRFGQSVAIDDDTAVITAYLDDDAGPDSGSAYVFTRSNAVWTLQQKLTPADGVRNGQFGHSASLDGGTAAIGAPRVDSANGLGTGATYIYTRSDGAWSLQQKLFASDGAFNDRFGVSVEMDGHLVVIGARFDDDNGIDSGSAYVFARKAGVWTEAYKLLASDGAAGDILGWWHQGVSISGGTAIAGAAAHEGWRGSAYVFDVATLATTDVKPGNTINPINPQSNGTITVAVLTTSLADGDAVDLDATQIDPLSAYFGLDGASETHQRGHIKDVDQDGDDDLVLHFKVQDTGIDCSDTETDLIAETFAGDVIVGQDSIRIVGCE